jgi:hypothetical protein
VQWEKTFGGGYWDAGTAVQQTTDGGYAIAATTLSFGAGDDDVYLIKTNSEGNIQWQKTYGGKSWDWGYSFQQTVDGGYIIVGETNSFGISDVYLIKTDPNGNLQWQKTFGSGNKQDRGNSVRQTSDGGYIIAGQTVYYGARNDDVYLIKTDSAGNLQWQKTFNERTCDRSNSVQQTLDGGYIIAGYTNSQGAGYDNYDDVYLIKTNSDGNEVWHKTFGGSSCDRAYSIQKTIDGGYAIAGVTCSFGAGDKDVYLIKTNSEGNMQWQKTFGGGYLDSDDSEGFSVQQTTDGGFIIAGRTWSFRGAASSLDVYIIKTDSEGNEVWHKTIGGNRQDDAFSVQQTTDGGYIIAGETYSFGAGSDDVYLIKAAPEGISLKRFEINQCFQKVDGIADQNYVLIETKPFVVRVSLERVTPGTTTANVKLSIFNALSGKQIATKVKSTEIRYGSSEPLDFRFIDNETKDMKAGDYKFSLIVEDNNGAKLFDWTGTYPFKSSKMVRILVVQLLIFDWNFGFWNDRYIEFLEQVFPVPKKIVTDVNHIEIAREWFLMSGYPLNNLWREMYDCLKNYNNTHISAPSDFICAVIPEGILPDNVAGIRRSSAVLIKSRDGSGYTLGHEIGHIYDLGEEYVYTTAKIPSGLWVLYQKFNFDCNPPPLKLDSNGPFIMILDHYNWADDKSSYSEPFFGDLGGGKIGWKCDGRYVGKGGFDLRKELNREVGPKTLTMMSAAGHPQWISGPEYKSLIAELVPTTSKSAAEELSAATPLSATSPSSGQSRMLVSGIIDIPARTAELSPLIPVPNLEPTAEAADPNCQLKFMSWSGDFLGSYNFAPLEGEEPNSQLQGPFCIIVDLPQNTTRIQVTINGVTADQLRLTDNSPIVSVLSPNGGEQITGEIVINWSASDPDTNDANDLAYTVEFSHDNGTEWSALTIDLDSNELTVDSNYLPGGPNCLVKVIASDGWNLAEDVSNSVFSITTKPPRVTILDPEDETILVHSESMQGRCTAYDPETGDIKDPNAIVWTSNIDGFLGKGNLTGFDLSLGHHTLTATATDPEGKTGTDTVTVTVVANFADFNCDRSVDLLDISELAENWQANCSEPDWCEGTDLDRSGVVDFADLAIFCENWLWQASYFSD